MKNMNCTCNHCFLYVSGLFLAFAYGMFVCVKNITILEKERKKILNSYIWAIYDACVLNTFFLRIRILFEYKCVNFDYPQDDISYKKVATQSHTYPGTGYDASKAVDGNRETCMRAEAIGSNSADKLVWWKVDLGGIYNIYDINILFKTYDGFGA